MKKNSHKAATSQARLEDGLTIRARLINRSVREILTVYVEAERRGVLDPLVLVTDDRIDDMLVTMLGLGRGTKVALVSASEFVSKYGSLVAAEIEVAIRFLEPDGLFVLCIAAGGASAAYVNYDVMTEELHISSTPGSTLGEFHQGCC